MQDMKLTELITVIIIFLFQMFSRCFLVCVLFLYYFIVNYFIFKANVSAIH